VSAVRIQMTVVDRLITSLAGVGRAAWKQICEAAKSGESYPPDELEDRFGSVVFCRANHSRKPGPSPHAAVEAELGEMGARRARQRRSCWHNATPAERLMTTSTSSGSVCWTPLAHRTTRSIALDKRQTASMRLQQAQVRAPSGGACVVRGRSGRAA
jgi:hypothetical protein